MTATREIFTTVSATGRADTHFKSASFSVSTVSRDKNTAAARAKADLVLTSVMETIKELNRKNAGIDMAGLKCSYDTQPWYEYDNATREQRQMGYMVTGSVNCTTDNVDAATVIMDALSKIENATVQRPTFSVDDATDARQAAFQAAYDRAFEDFNLQCAVLRVDPDDYEVVRYSPTNEMQSTRGMVVAASMSAESPMAAPAEIKAGRAEVSAYVRLDFAKKTKSKPRATSAPAKRTNGGTARGSYNVG